MKCKVCGAKISEEMTACELCGTVIESDNNDYMNKSDHNEKTFENQQGEMKYTDPFWAASDEKPFDGEMIIQDESDVSKEIFAKKTNEDMFFQDNSEENAANSNAKYEEDVFSAQNNTYNNYDFKMQSVNANYGASNKTKIVIGVLTFIIATLVVAVIYLCIHKKPVKEYEMVKNVKEENVENFGIPVFDDISASSELAPYGDNYYNCQNVVDDDVQTAWVEGVSGSGKGESIVFKASERQKISGIKILNGYCKSEKLYKKNNRVKTVNVLFSNGSAITKELGDKYLEYSVILLDSPVICTSFTVTIEDVYNGTEYDDTCISEIKVY